MASSEFEVADVASASMELEEQLHRRTRGAER
jgi:hypothetical protein